MMVEAGVCSAVKGIALVKASGRIMLSSRLRKLIALLDNRHTRKKSGLVLAEGLRCCQEAMGRRPDWLEAVLMTSDFAASSASAEILAKLSEHGLEPVILSEREFNRLNETEHPQGVMAVLRRPEWTLPTSLPEPFVLILDQVSEPGNLGTILRTAWAVGLPSVWLVKGGADPYAPKVIRAGMGAQFALELAWFPDLAAAAQCLLDLGGNRLCCAMPQAELSLYDERFSLTGGGLVIGNEARGVSAPELGAAVTIPMPGEAESLNAAQAATVFLCDYCLRRRK